MFGNCARIIRSGICPQAVAKTKLNSSRIFGFVRIDGERETIIYIYSIKQHHRSHLRGVHD